MYWCNHVRYLWYMLCIYKSTCKCNGMHGICGICPWYVWFGGTGRDVMCRGAMQCSVCVHAQWWWWWWWWWSCWFWGDGEQYDGDDDNNDFGSHCRSILLGCERPIQPRQLQNMLQNLDLNSATEIDLDDLMRFLDVAVEWREGAATKIVVELWCLMFSGCKSWVLWLFFCRIFSWMWIFFEAQTGFELSLHNFLQLRIPFS